MGNTLITDQQRRHADYPELYDMLSHHLDIKYIDMIRDNPHLLFLMDVRFIDENIDYNLVFESLMTYNIIWIIDKMYTFRATPLRDHFEKAGIHVSDETHIIDEYYVIPAHVNAVSASMSIAHKTTFPYVLPVGEYIKFIDLDTVSLNSDEDVSSILIRHNYYKEGRGLKDLLKLLSLNNYIVNKDNIYEWLVKGVVTSGYTTELTILMRNHILNSFYKVPEEKRNTHIFVPYFYVLDNISRRCESCKEEGAVYICFTHDLSEVFYHRRCLNILTEYYKIERSYKRMMLVDVHKEVVPSSPPSECDYATYNIHDIHKTYLRFFEDMELDPNNSKYYEFGDNLL